MCIRDRSYSALPMNLHSSNIGDTLFSQMWLHTLWLQHVGHFEISLCLDPQLNLAYPTVALSKFQLNHKKPYWIDRQGTPSATCWSQVWARFRHVVLTVLFDTLENLDLTSVHCCSSLGSHLCNFGTFSCIFTLPELQITSQLGEQGYKR